MDMFEFFANIALALGALVIAALQFKEEIRNSREEKREQAAREQEKRIMEQIVSQVIQIESCSDSVFRFTAKMDAFSERTDSDPNEVMATFDRMIEEYTADFQKISPYLEQLYNELLMNEERFPMSHGYGRHITELREILDFRTVERERRNLGYDRLRVEVHHILLEAYNKGGVLAMEDRLALGQKTENMIQALEPYYRHATRVRTILYELKVKHKKQSA